MAIFLGIVQGITEFIPISSSGHLAILQNIFSLGYDEEAHMFFNVLLHLGTLTSICLVYKQELKGMISDTLDHIRNRDEIDSDEPLKPNVRMVIFILAATVPLILGLIFRRQVERLFMNTGFIGFALLITGGLLFVSDRYIKTGDKKEKTITLVDAIIVGLAQAVAVIPGLSRSGTTIAVGMTRGFNRSFAVRFSLLLSIPAVVGAGLVELVSAFRIGINVSMIPAYLIGMIFAAVVGYFSVQLLRRLATQKGKFGKIAYYCWGVGVLTILLSIVL